MRFSGSLPLAVACSLIASLAPFVVFAQFDNSTSIMQSQNIPSAASMPGVQGLSMTPDPTASAQCSVWPYNQVCTSSTFFGWAFTMGHCQGPGKCVADAVTPIGAVLVGLGTNLINTAVNYALRPNTPSGGISINTVGSNNCLSGRYPTSDPSRLTDPCAYYVVPTTTTPGGCDIVSQLLGKCGGTNATTTTQNDTTSAALSVSPNTGAAPLVVTFTVTDTSPSCTRSPIILSAGDGSNPITALQATANACGNKIATFSYTYHSAGTYQATVKNQTTQQTLQSVTVIVTSSSSTSTTTTTTTTTTPTDLTNAALSASPTSGDAPLTVTFTINDTSSIDTSTACRRSAVMLSAGDGSNAVQALPAASTCATTRPGITFTYTYRTSGVFNASIANQNTGQTLQSVKIAVLGGGASASAGTVDVSSSLLNLVGNLNVSNTNKASSATPAPAQGAVQPNTQADIQVTSSGITVVSGGVRDASGKTGVSAFFGADSSTASAASGLIARMCLVQPWRNSVISSRIKVSIFDGLCSGRSVPVGVPASAAAVSASQTPASSSKPAASSASTTQVAAPSVPPAVAVWAVPASVALGARTSIFWNSRGVSSCIVTSPDGSFKETTLAGSASTVPLSGPTVFTISCLAPDGSHVTNFVKVDISS